MDLSEAAFREKFCQENLSIARKQGRHTGLVRHVSTCRRGRCKGQGIVVSRRWVA